jgi:hypothetical protein
MSHLTPFIALRAPLGNRIRGRRRVVETPRQADGDDIRVAALPKRGAQSGDRGDKGADPGGDADSDVQP